MTTINLTQHPATAEQIAAGVFDLPADARPDLQSLLTFGELPTEADILARADEIAYMASGIRNRAAWQQIENEDRRSVRAPEPKFRALIGGALWLMAPLAQALRELGIEPVFAFSVRETEEQTQADGSIRKVAVFRHAGFVAAVES